MFHKQGNKPVIDCHSKLGFFVKSGRKKGMVAEKRQSGGYTAMTGKGLGGEIGLQTAGSRRQAASN
jgi:hypothetical protein